MEIYVISAFLLSLFMCAIDALTVDFSNYKPKYTTHPLLYFNKRDIPDLIAKASTTHEHITKVIDEAVTILMGNPKRFLPPTDYAKFGGIWNEYYGNNLPPLALYTVLHPEDKKAKIFLLEYMDLMAGHPKWQVIAAATDEVPVAHSLTGFATAFDWIYNTLDSKRQKLYLQRIFNETKDFNRYIKIRSWGHFYLQNHVATNLLAFLHGALVVHAHLEEAKTWVETAVYKLEQNMKLFNHLIDGSSDEGVPYGSYTSRSMMQYIFLALRHFRIDHTKDIWVKEHYWFYYHTVKPQFQRTLSVADSNHNWFYGPESQAVFLDAYVMKNGWGNWLAREIRNARPDPLTDTEKLKSADSQRWCTIHTEYIWYDATIPAVPPPSSGKPTMHVFSDWGVVTYSSTDPRNPNDTFLSFKSGALMGAAMSDVVKRDMYKSWPMNGWNSFNPGHEHPDQNTFEFVPNGRLFVTDGLYSSKLSHYNNILSFAPSPTSHCQEPWEGQLGECAKWLDWKNPDLVEYRGDLISTATSNDFVFIAGEAAPAYNPSMKLESVYRSLTLLNPNLLLVFDHVEASESSPLTHLAAYFRNVQYSFELDKLSSLLQGASITMDGEKYSMYWISSDGRSTVAAVQEEKPSQYQARPTSFVNMTFKLSPRITRLAYILCGPSIKLKNLQFLESIEDGVTMFVGTSDEDYQVMVSTKHSDPVARLRYLKYPGHATVQRLSKPSEIVKFGVAQSFFTETPSQLDSSPVKWILFIAFILSALAFFWFGKKTRLRPRSRIHSIGIGLCFVWVIIWVSVINNCAIFGCDTDEELENSVRSSGHQAPLNTLNNKMLPSVVITSLPGSGAELISWLFHENPDFIYMVAPSIYARLPRGDGIEVNPITDACEWNDSESLHSVKLKQWVQDMRWSPELFVSSITDKNPQSDVHFTQEMIQAKKIGRRLLAVQEQPKIENKEFNDIIYKTFSPNSVRSHLEKYPNAQGVLFFKSGGWTLKLPWINSVLKNTLHAIHFVRDPRAFVANYLRKSEELYKAMDVKQSIKDLFDQSEKSCVDDNGQYAWEFEKLRAEYRANKNSALRLLASLWASHTGAILRKASDLPIGAFKLVKVEDLVMESEKTAEAIHRHIGIPLRPTTLQKLIQAAKSSVYKLPYELAYSERSIDLWRRELNTEQITEIEQICGPVMTQLGYVRETKSMPVNET
ncbi:dermatan-sulfate epimerase-like protein [Strongylocentrotus purpuratus]|uniref:Heparinase II N-terminal domain-containing protein n=1 Tax=Strongylocentrotus purpuratus TaxID=7668 RepID=A0A7M7RF69_STRPU|nr:dermatan-sulfate epimerase-like protein [Strongylocentrotus purpuratus]